MTKAPKETSGPFSYLSDAPLVGAGLECGYLFLESQLLLFQSPELGGVRYGPSRLLLDMVIQCTVTVSQLSYTRLNRHGLRLHV